MEPGLTLEVLWGDQHLTELLVQASNGRFAATVACYVAHDCFLELAAAVKAFPKSSDDRREHTFVAFAPAADGTGAKLVLRCTDRLGHCAVDVVVNGTDGASPASAAFSFPVEPAAIDAFVAALGRTGVVPGAVVRLPMAT
jgi:hypothetical protein